VGGDPVAIDSEDFEDLLEYCAGIESVEEIERLVNRLPTPVRRRMVDAFSWQAHCGQEAPRGDWRVWLIMAGRGFGKTRAGAEWVWARARENCSARIALVAGSLAEAKAVMVEGASGLLACARTGETPLWLPSRGLIVFPSGARGFVYSADAPESLRGPEHDFAWADELAKWRHAEAAWANLRMGLRRGEAPRAVVTTTPRPVAALRAIRAAADTAETGGATAANPHLASDFAEAMAALYGGTRIGRQELEGELIEDLEGALWTRDLLERCRSRALTPGPSPESGRGEMRRVVVGVDPPASAEGDSCGIVVCAVDGAGVAWVLADCSSAGLSPEGWARRVAAAAETWGAHRVVAEKNNGGAMVESVLRGASVNLPVKLVHASEGKSARAEPVAALFERGAARLAGVFPELEDEMCGLTLGGGYEGPGRSPDRADAMVWAMSELMLGREHAEPRIRLL
jgi:phage terminase large subunit-like protein